MPSRTSKSLRLAALALVVPPVLLAASLQDRPPSKRETKEWIEQYFALDLRSEAGLASGDALLEQLADVPLARASDLKTWRKHLAKEWKRGEELETGGTNWLWEDEQRGKYIVGGKTKNPKGLAICMHGGGVGSGSAESAHGAYQGAISSMDWLGIYPEVLEKTERGWTDSGTEEFVMELVDRALRTWDIDKDRVYFVGHSMGGYGSWTLGAHHADRVAALAPSAGAPTPILGQDGKARDVVDGVIPNLRNVPLVIFQSADDPRVPPDANRAAVKALEKAQERWGGFPYEYWEVTGVGHGAPPGGYRAHLEKVAEFERGELPTKVVWQPELAWKRQFYWLWWEAPRPGVIVEAEVDWEARRVDVSTSGAVERLSLLLREDLCDLEQPFSVRIDGKEVWSGVPEPAMDVLVATSRHGDERLQFLAKVPIVR